MARLRPKIALLALFSLWPCVSYLRAQTPAESQAERYWNEGEKALAAGQYADAEKAYQKLLQLDPGAAEAHARLGVIYFQEKKFDQAASSLHQALKLQPSLPKLDTLLAMSLSELGQYDQALPGLERGFKQSTDPPVKRMCGLQLERAYTGLGRDEKAVEVALELNRLYPDDPEVLYHTGQLFGNFAFLTAKKLAEVAPNSIWRHQAAAEEWESQGSYELAIDEYRAVLTLDPRRPGIHYRLGRTLLARAAKTNSPQDLQTDSQAALQEFTSELELDPTNANAAYELGEAHRGHGETDDARKYFELALKYYPDFVQANLGLAAVLLREGDAAGARVHAQKAIAASPQNEVAWYRLSQAERALGDSAGQQKALAEFQELRQRSKDLAAATAIFSPEDVTPQKVEGDSEK
jgi:tetratricopeptide (TPR) repeat protein